MKKIKSLAMPGIKIQFLHCPAYSPVTVLTELSWLVTIKLYLSSKIVDILENSAALFMPEWWKTLPQKIDVEEGTDSYEFLVNQNCVNRTGHEGGWVGDVTLIGEVWNACGVLVLRPEERIALGRPE